MAATTGWLLGLSVLAAVGGAQTVTKVMYPENSQKSSLFRQISIPNQEGADTLARAMPPEDVGAVLKDSAGSDKSSVRMLVLTLASKYPSEGASRAILSRLTDSNLTVKSIAGSLISMIAQKNLVPEMLDLAEQELDPRVRGALVRQVGVIGDASDLPRLRAQHRAAQDDGLRNDLVAAMARLGDSGFRDNLIQRLSDSQVPVRIQALHDVSYVADRRLVLYLPPDVEDRRDAIVISFPHDPTEWARVCDVAIQTMAGLGVKLSFATAPTRRFTEAEIHEALQILAALQQVK